MKLHQRIRQDPDFFFRDILGCHIWQKQRDIVLSLRDHRNTSVRSCHGAGKTHILARVALWFMFAFPRAIVIQTAPTDRQVRHQFWKELRIAHRRARRPLGGKLLQTRFEINEDWYAFGFSTRETEGGSAADKFQGFHGQNILVVVDEASGVKGAVFEAIDGVMSGGEVARRIYCGNPTRADGDFFKSFSDPSFNRIHISAYDIPNVKTGRTVIPGLSTLEWVEEMKKRYGEDSDVFRVRVKGEPPQEGGNIFIPVSLVDQAIDADREWVEQYDSVLGVDPARYGDDSTDMVERTGNKARIHDIAFSQSITDTAGKVIAWLLEKKRGRVNIDTIGLGAGVYDVCKEDGRVADRVFAVNVAHAPRDDDDGETVAAERFAALRDQGWDMAKTWLKTAILVKHDNWHQLCAPRFKWDMKGRLKIESKDEMKKRKVMSPNTADALIVSLLPGETEGGGGAWTG